MRSFLGKMFEVASGIVAVCGVLMGVIWITGGSFPFWVTIADAQQTRQGIADQFRQNTEQLKEVGKTIQEIGKSLSALNRRADGRDCKDLTRALLDARTDLAKNPNSMSAQILVDNLIGQMADIPSGCTSGPPSR